MNANSNSATEVVGNVDNTSVTKSPTSKSLIVKIEGWVLHSEHDIVDLYFEVKDSLLRQTTRLPRPDIETMYPELPFARNSGYRFQFEIPPEALVSPCILSIFATLANGNRINTVIPVVIEHALSMHRSAATLTSDDALLRQSALRAFLSDQQPLEFPVADSPKLSIIVATHNRAADSYACFCALHTQMTSNIELIIVDNASTDATAYLLELMRNVKIIRNSENLHFLSAARQGAVAATGELLLFLNNDTQILAGALDAVMQSFRDHPKLGVLGARLIHTSGTLQEVGGRVFPDGSTVGIGVGEHPLAAPFLVQRAVDYCSGAFLATPRTLWHDLGGFDLRYAPAYYEDVDYCFSARAKGFQVLIEPRIAVIHREGAIHEHAEEAKALMIKNREKFLVKHGTAVAALPLKREPITPPAIADSKNILIIDDFFPLQKNGQGAPRAKLIVDSLISQGYRVTFAALNDETPISSPLLSSPSGSRMQYRALARGDSLLEFLAFFGASFGQIIVSRPHNMEDFKKVRAQYPVTAKNARIIYDSEAIFALRELRRKEQQLGETFSASEIEKIVSKEILAVQGADQFWCVSQSEALEFLKRGVEPVSILGFGVSPREEKPAINERSGILFIGPLLDRDTPNDLGFLWYLREVAPLLEKKLADHQQALHKSSALASLLGRAAEPVSGTLTHVGINRFRDLPTRDRIVFAGAIDDLTSYYQRARAFAAPITFGSGIPIKVIEAAAHGLPIVTTSYIAQQLQWKHEVELLVADDAEQFAQQLFRALTDDSLWLQLRKNLFHGVKKDFSLQSFQQSLISLLQPSPSP